MLRRCLFEPKISTLNDFCTPAANEKTCFMKHRNADYIRAKSSVVITMTPFQRLCIALLAACLLTPVYGAHARRNVRDCDVLLRSRPVVSLTYNGMPEMAWYDEALKECADVFMDLVLPQTPTIPSSSHVPMPVDSSSAQFQDSSVPSFSSAPPLPSSSEPMLAASSEPPIPPTVGVDVTGASSVSSTSNEVPVDSSSVLMTTASALFVSSSDETITEMPANDFSTGVGELSSSAFNPTDLV
jgi:hypothetical protein